MAIRRQPSIRFDVDWDDDDYASARADNTAYLQSLTYSHGSNVSANPDRPNILSARGRVVFVGDRFKRDDPNYLGDAVVDRRHRARLLVNGVVQWTGLVEAPRRRRGGVSFVIAGLLGEAATKRVQVRPN